MDAEDPLVTAIGDFPKRGILVRSKYSLSNLQTLLAHISGVPSINEPGT